ncbi:acyl-CoA dehydrogenase [Acinetobacter halotolerans]|uniref:Acyl-CoA dehydrogenase n=1 Tax=Acinetobacter halotolerans TaxID=1752076 RepID=A0A4V2DB94_9GAMM|nr:acyl-CoA dehydrogenase [Acinetobacter halotolerans]RZF55859.1 acyl-CoA dehydrogenase [Acinetobacter halotolerans]
MNIKIPINISVMNILNQLENNVSEDKSKQRLEALRHLVSLTDRLPHPTSGQTYQRWQTFAQIAGFDLSLAKLFESHCDALSILHELGSFEDGAKEIWAVWAAEGPTPLQVKNDLCNGLKYWCSGAQFVQKALISYKNKEGQAQLGVVELNQPSIHVDLTQWKAIGMQATETGRVYFENTPIRLIGEPNSYLDRAGFWHGAAGVAACWYGAAARLMSFLQQNCQESPNSFKKMYLGELSQKLAVTKQYFHYIADRIDDKPTHSHEREIRILRAQTEECCLRVIELVGKALGARPFCENHIFANLMADLPVFIRQSHAAFDYEQIAELTLRELSVWEL